ncbi:Fc.00g108370.m01.CDS01 [Cosmosporella sp. VM-42]
MRFLSPLCVLPLLAATASCRPEKDTKLPTVDLGYELHQAISYNDTTEVFKFSNIRYAQSPTGDLRFRAPLPPLTSRDQVRNGSEPRLCPQGVPVWQAKAFRPIGQYSNGKPFTLESWESDIKNSSVPEGDFNGVSSEDCLFLDVHVPRKIFKRASEKSKKKCDAPVLVWIHGGGYVFGSKNGVPTPGYDPVGLLKHAQQYDDGMIFVALNYRLGALGFLASPEVEADGALNAGLLDQRLALDWVQQNVHLFGGNPDRVTIMGESAGGGSALLQMTGSPNDTDIKAPFAQVIAQSPAIIPTAVAPESAHSDFLALLNVSTLSEARQVSSEAIIQANARQIGAAPPTTYTYGPVKDNKFVQDLPLELFKKGAFDKSVKVLAAHNALEGGFFFDANVETEDEFHAWLQRSIPGLTDSEREELENNIYPANFDLGLGYVDQGSRQMALWGEAVIDCNFLAINEAFEGNSYAYEFNVAPGLHIQDLTYTFNNPTSPAFKPKAQDILQTAITSFVINGTPVSKAGSCPEQFPHWGSDKTLVSINGDGIKISTNNVNETRCAWWQNALGKVHS